MEEFTGQILDLAGGRVVKFPSSWSNGWWDHGHICHLAGGSCWNLKFLDDFIVFRGPYKVRSTVVKIKVLREVSAGCVATLYETILKVIGMTRHYQLPSCPPSPVTEIVMVIILKSLMEIYWSWQETPWLISWPYNCAAHRLNLAVSDCIKDRGEYPTAPNMPGLSEQSSGSTGLQQQDQQSQGNGEAFWTPNQAAGYISIQR